MFEVRGIQWFDGRWNNSYVSAKGRQSLDELKQNIPHCNYCYLDTKCNISGSTCTPRYEIEAELKGAMAYAKQQGYKLAIRGGLNAVTETTFMPADIATFFSTFGDSLAYWAAICEQYGVELFGIGVELELIETDAYSQYWLSIIEKVRAVYSGTIFYSINWMDSQIKSDRKQAASWMNSLDYLVISCYPMLMTQTFFNANYAYPNTPTPEALMPGYTSFVAWGSDPAHSFKGQNLVDHFRQLGSAHGTPIIFHMGLGSFYGACYQPWAAPSSGQVDLQGQVNWLHAFFNTFGGEPWVTGWLVDGAWLTVLLAEKNGNNLEFSIQNKPSTALMEWAFEQLSPEISVCSEGYHWDAGLNQCVHDDCQAGFHWDETLKQCVPDALDPVINYIDVWSYPDNVYVPQGGSVLQGKRVRIYSQISNVVLPVTINYGSGPLAAAYESTWDYWFIDWQTSLNTAAVAYDVTVESGDVSFTAAGRFLVAAEIPSHDCPAGQHWDETAQVCVADLPPPDGHCFIATVCGTSSPGLSVLRLFRDKYGPSQLVAAYYSLSPGFARLISGHIHVKSVGKKCWEWLACQLRKNLTF